MALMMTDEIPYLGLMRFVSGLSTDQFGCYGKGRIYVNYVPIVLHKKYVIIKL